MHEKLRIVTNGTKFRIQSLGKSEYGEFKVRSPEISFWKGKLKNTEILTKYSEYWTFVDKDGNKSITINYHLGYPTETVPIEFNSKKESLEWIKTKYGEDGLKLLKGGEEWIEVDI